MQRANGKDVRWRHPSMRQTTLPYGGRPAPTPRAQGQPPYQPYRVPQGPARAQSQQPPYQPYRNPQGPRQAAPAAMGQGPAARGPRPGILKKPAPKLQQQPIRYPGPSLPSWRYTAPRTQVTFTLPPTQQQPMLENSGGRRQPPARQKTCTAPVYANPPPNPAVAGSIDANASQSESSNFRILSVGAAAVKGTHGIHEVFGVLDCAPTANRQGLMKHFTLRQDKSSVSCIFYQIDRVLGALQKGSLLRCVGFMNRAGQLSVVSARLATEDEKRALNVLTAVAAV